MDSTLKPDTGRVGIVLAGGRSARFEGGDKAQATLAGRPLLHHAVRSVAPAVDDVVVSCRTDQTEAFAAILENESVDFAVDPIDDLGPVSGLRTALDETDRLTGVVVPCDMPFVPSAFLGHLLDRVEQSSTAGVVSRLDGRIQPLPTAVNVRAAAAAATEALDTNGSLLDVVEALAPVVIPEQNLRAIVEPDRLFDINSRTDLARAEQQLTRMRRSADRDTDPDEPEEIRPNRR